MTCHLSTPCATLTCNPITGKCGPYQFLSISTFGPVCPYWLDLGPKAGHLPAFQGDLPRCESAKGPPPDRTMPYRKHLWLFLVYHARACGGPSGGSKKILPLKNETTIGSVFLDGSPQVVANGHGGK
ncbi:hypothetical protein OIU74_004102 [Salix koriyanagi]|uniref:Uncharacterized protein n=1 Tax=Salix koriyanagi TaxID=2511006 RepID=A0A9Q0ZLX9_9ROSI|nr:hypothetical protein OIU74_004102 [Salix koriyanagi]